MPDCEFGEAQFEFDLTMELTVSHGPGLPFFRPTPALEKLLGYDEALYTDYFGPTYARAYARSYPRAYPGINYGGNLVASGSPMRIPARRVSAFLQMKRPFYRTVGRGSARRIWNRWKQAHFSIRVDDPSDQMSTLARLERNTHGRALVRIATPTFWKWSDLDAYKLARTIADNTHFVSPRKLVNHGEYTYRLPRQAGIAFSEPEEVMPEDLKQSIERIMQGQEVEETYLADYLAELRSAVVEAAPKEGALRDSISKSVSETVEKAKHIVGNVQVPSSNGLSEGLQVLEDWLTLDALLTRLFDVEWLMIEG